MTNADRRPIPRFVWSLLALGGLLLFNLVFTRGFFDIAVRDGHLYGSLIDIVNRAAPVALLSIGMTLVIATAGVDLSVGAVMAIAGAVAAWLLTATHVGLAGAIVVALAAGIAAGACNGVLVAACGIQPIVATLVLMVAGRGVAQLITAGQILTVEHAGFSFIGGGHLFGLPLTVTLVAGAALTVGLLVRRTALGLFIAAIGNNPAASRYAGLPVGGVKVAAYACSGLCAGLAGLVAASDIKAADANNAGLYLELDAILAVVIGGTALTGGRFTLFGSLCGALVIQTLTTTILSRDVPVEWNLVVKALVVLTLCLLQAPRFRAWLRIGR
jgi:galactofuranose transport system permease protein